MDDDWWIWREQLSQVCGVLSLIPNMRTQSNQILFFLSFFLSSPFHSIRSRSILDCKNSKMNRDDRRSSSAHIYSLASPTFLPSFLLFFFLSLSPFCSYRQLYYLIILFFRGDTRHAKSYLSPHAFNRSYPACFISLVIASQLSRSNIAKRYVPDIKETIPPIYADINGY